MASSLLSWRLASASSLSRACRWASVAQRRGIGSGSELLEAEATQKLHFRVGSHYLVVGVLRVVAGPEVAPVAHRLLT
jgi:hypothetical protein